MRIKLNSFEWNYTLNGKSWNIKEKATERSVGGVYRYANTKHIEATCARMFHFLYGGSSKLACTQNTTLKSIIYFENLVFAVIFLPFYGL